MKFNLHMSFEIAIPPKPPREEEYGAAKRAVLKILHQKHPQSALLSTQRHSDEEEKFDGSDEMFNITLEYDLHNARCALRMFFSVDRKGLMHCYGDWHEPMECSFPVKDDVAKELLRSVNTQDRIIIIRQIAYATWIAYVDVLKDEAFEDLRASLQEACNVLAATDSPLDTSE